MSPLRKALSSSTVNALRHNRAAAQAGVIHVDLCVILALHEHCHYLAVDTDGTLAICSCPCHQDPPDLPN